MGGGGSKPSPPPPAAPWRPIFHKPAPPKPLPPPPPKGPPKPAVVPSPPGAEPLKVTVKPIEPRLTPPGKDMYTQGPLLYGRREVTDMIKTILKSEMDMQKVKAPDSEKILSIPDTIQRYTKALCQGNPRSGGDGLPVLKAGTKCQIWGNDLKDSKDFKIEIDDFRYGKLRKDPEVRPAATVTADSDNDSPQWQVEKLSRTVTVREKSHFNVSSGIQAGAQLSVSAGMCNDLVCAKKGTEFNPGVDTTKSDENKKDTETTLHLSKTVNVPPYGHADVVWTVFEREVDIPWEAKAVISGNFNMYYWEAPAERYDQNSCAQIIRSFVEQKVVHSEDYAGLPTYLEACGLHITKIPVCEALIWQKKIRPENAEKDFSKCWYTIDGVYEGVKANDWKSQVETKPVSSKLSWWQSARYHGAVLEKMEPTPESMDRMREFVATGKPYGPVANSKKSAREIQAERGTREKSRAEERARYKLNKAKAGARNLKWSHVQDDRVDHPTQAVDESASDDGVRPYDAADASDSWGAAGEDGAFAGDLAEDGAGFGTGAAALVEAECHAAAEPHAGMHLC